MDRLEIKAAFTADDTGELTGIAWPFGTPDQVGDVIEPKSFSSITSTLPMLFGHDQNQPIGVWDSITETDQGLEVKGRLMIETVTRAREIHSLIREKALSGLSIGFVTRKASPRRSGGRTITALDLHEISVVSVPCHPGARILSAKADSAANPQHDKGTPMENEHLEALETKLAARLDKVEARLNRPAIITGNDTEADVEKKAFLSYARKGVEHMPEIERKALTVAVDANAGFLAPESFASEIIKLTREFSPIRQYAKVQTIGSAEVKVPRRTGSTAAVWTAENTASTGSEPSYEQLVFTPYELRTHVDVSNQLLEDNVFDLEGELAADLAESFAIKEGQSFVSGDGTGKPTGFLATGAILNEIKTGIAADLPGTDTAIADKLFDLFHAIPTMHSQNGTWVMNRNILKRLRKIKDSTGSYLLMPSGLVNGPAWTILGRPVCEAIDMPDVAAGANPVVFGDLSAYRIMDRVGFSMLRDPYSQALNGLVRFYARKRVAAAITHPDRLVRLKCSV